MTSFFAGTSDDAGVCEYAPVMEAVYGREFAVGELAGKEREFADFHERTAALRAPAVNSRPIWDGEENQIPGFRFIGQRFSVDAAVMQKLIYSDVGENGAGQKRNTSRCAGRSRRRWAAIWRLVCGGCRGQQICRIV